MRHVNERHKITDDVHQSIGLSWKPFDKKNQIEKMHFLAHILFFSIYIFAKIEGAINMIFNEPSTGFNFLIKLKTYQSGLPLSFIIFWFIDTNFVFKPFLPLFWPTE